MASDTIENNSKKTLSTRIEIQYLKTSSHKWETEYIPKSDIKTKFTAGIPVIGNEKDLNYVTNDTVYDVFNNKWWQQFEETKGIYAKHNIALETGEKSTVNITARRKTAHVVFSAKLLATYFTGYEETSSIQGTYHGEYMIDFKTSFE